VALKEPPELEGAEVDVPDPIVDLFEADILPDADGRDVDPAAEPTTSSLSARPRRD